MNTLVELALSNLLMAALLAVPAVLAGWWGRRPALTHGLWLLVLLKLVTPPLYRVPISWPETATQAATPSPVDHGPVVAIGPPQVEVMLPPLAEPVAPLPMPMDDPAPVELLPAQTPEAPIAVPEPVIVATVAWTDWMLLPWLAGGLAWLLVAAWRLDRFHRLLRFARAAPGDVQAEASALARRMGVRCPQVLTLPGTVSPMLWAMGTAPRLLVPAELLDRLRPAQRATLLVHELAHWRRGDHLVRWLEVLAFGLYWWCPLVWWACRQLRQAEEECCDAWVVALLPDAAREYALALVETIDFLSGAPHVLPPAASGAGHVRLLQRRLTMIMRGTTPQSLTRTGLLVLGGLGLALLPLMPGLAQTQAPKDARAVEDAERRQLELAQAERDFALAVQLGDEAKAQQLQAELERARQELEARRRDLEARAEAIQRALIRARELAPGPAGGGDALPKATGGGSGTMKPGQPAFKSSIDQRLDQVEKKLDTLLWEVTNLRRDLLKAHPGPQGSGMGPPGAGGYRPNPEPPPAPGRPPGGSGLGGPPTGPGPGYGPPGGPGGSAPNVPGVGPRGGPGGSAPNLPKVGPGGGSGGSGTNVPNVGPPGGLGGGAPNVPNVAPPGGTGSAPKQ
jgi:beta-lactamase regulating signal transducer with metallopeptidase domain